MDDHTPAAAPSAPAPVDWLSWLQQFPADLIPQVSAYAAAREAAATAALRAELDLRRKSGSAVDRLHNLCEGIAESADGSEWSREEWERIDAENAELRAAVERVRGVLEAAQNDAMRFRWLTEDHADPETRAKCRDLLSRMGVMTYSAACRDIDSAMAQATKREMLRTAVEWQRRYEPTCAHGRYSDEDCADCPRTAEAAARAELGVKA
jgi:lipopolysaccharide biosynthesis protein